MSFPTSDGRKLFDSYSHPAGLKDELQARLGVFPLLKFWGPGADIASTRWIASCAVEVMRRHEPSLTLVYLPHLDYNLQRLGPDDPRIAEDVRAVDAEAGRVIDSDRTSRTLWAEVVGIRDLPDLVTAQRRFAAWRTVYTHQRPHEALDFAVPADRYQPSPRAWPERLPALV